MNLSFQPLAKERLAEALSLIADTFPDYLEQVTKVYAVSLEKNKNDEYWKTRRILDYWIAVDTDKNKVVALTGFYQLTEHPENEIWLGWYCVAPSERGKGIGRQTLEWTVKEARKRGYATFKLWTTTDPNEAVAQKLYDRLGLKVYKKEFDQRSGETTLYRRMQL